MKLKQHLTPMKIAIFLALLLAIWLILGDSKSALDEAPEQQKKQAASLTQVQIRNSQAEVRDHELVLQGQLTPWQQVTITAQVSGSVKSLLKYEGDAVKSEQHLLKISDEGRSQRLTQATATLTLRERELANARSLEQYDFVAKTEISRFESALAEAKAIATERQLAVQYNTAIAPFDGVVNRRYVELGEWVSMGTALMDVVEVARLRATAFVPQQQVGDIKVGQGVKVELLDGRSMSAEVSFVSYSADAQTRSYLVEIMVPNPSGWRVSGASVTLRVQLPQVLAHQFSPALLSLNGKGQLGVKAVDPDNRVQFYPVNTIAVSTDAATVTQLPDTLKLITLGAGFVEVGQEVEPLEAQE